MKLNPLLERQDIPSEVKEAIKKELLEYENQLLQKEKELKQLKRKQILNYQITNIFLSVPDDRMYSEFFNLVLGTLESDYGIFGYIDENGSLVCPSITENVRNRLQIHNNDIIFPQESWSVTWRRIIIDKVTFYSNEPLELPEEHTPISRALGVPIVYRGEVIAILFVANKITDYDENDQQILETIANFIAPILHARLQRDLQVKERKQIQDDLIKTKARLEYLLRSGPAIIYACEPWGDYQVNFMSENAKEILGYDPRNFQQNYSFWVERIHPEDKQRVTKSFSKILDEHYFSDIYRFQHKDDTYRWMFEEANLIRDEEGAPLEIVGYWTDITLQKQAEEQVRTEKENFYNILNSIDDFIYIVNSQHEIEFINASLEKEFGPIDGKKCYEYFNDFTEVCPWCKMKEVIKGETIRWEKTLSRNQRTYDIIDTPLKNLDGRVSNLSIFRDITERKLAEKLLQESEEKYRSFVENFQGIAFKGYEDYSQDFFLGNVEVITGYIENDFVSGKIVFKNLIHPEDSHRIANDVEEFHASSRESTQREYRIIDKYGKVHWLQEDIQKFYDENKRKGGVYGTIQEITKRKQAEEALRKSEEKLRNLIEESTDGIILADEDGLIIEWNKSMEEITGLKKEEVQGKFAWEVNFMVTREEFRTHEHYDRDKTVFLNLLKKGEAPTNLNLVTTEITTPGGVKRGIQYQIFPIRTSDGFMIGSIIRDITEHRKTEEALKKSEEKYRLLFESTPIGIGISDLEGRVLEANQKILDTMGYTTEEIKKISLPDTYVNSEDRKKLLKVLLETGHVRDFEVQLKRKDGTPYYSLLNINLMKLGDQKVCLTTQRDLTEWKQLDRAKRESEERLRIFMESATDGFTLLDSKLNFIDMNKAGMESLGLLKDEIIGKNFIDIFPNLQNTGEYDKYLDVLRTGKPYYIDDVFFTPKIRQKFYSVRAFKVAEGLGIITTDITDRAKAERAREELEQRRDSFVWMTSHELRTPLTVLTGYSDFLLEHFNDLSQKRIMDILNVMKSNLERLERLTDKVSTIGQIEQGIFEIEKTEMNLCEFLQKTIDPYQLLLGEQFKFQGYPEDPSTRIEGDPNRLQQVLDNIIGNAIKQTDKNHRKIMVISKKYPTNIKIEVSDNGAGIASKDLEIIFEQFVSIPTEYSATGTGIGLYLCRKILTALGGTIKAQSNGPGHGATFIIELPTKSDTNSEDI
jgi:PAS domain S-box-containing protein